MRMPEMCAKPETYWLSCGYHVPQKPLSHVDCTCVYLWKGLELRLRRWEVRWAKGLHLESGELWNRCFLWNQEGRVGKIPPLCSMKKEKQGSRHKLPALGQKSGIFGIMWLANVSKTHYSGRSCWFSEGLVNEYEWINTLLHFIGW